MANLIKMQLFRMKRSRLGYFMTGGMVLMSLLIYTITYFITSSDFMMYVNNDLAGETFETTAFTLLGMFMPMFLPIILLNFLGTNHSTGYTKNLVGYLDNSLAVAGSQLVIGVLYLLVLLVAYLVVTVVAGVIVTGSFWFDNAGKAIAAIAVQCLIALAYTFLWQAVADLLKKPLLGMIFSIIYVAFSQFIYLLVDQLVQALSNYTSSFALEKYTLLGNAQLVSGNAATEDLLRATVIALVILGGSFALDMLACKKRTY